MMDRHVDLDRFYDLMAELADRIGGSRHLIDDTVRAHLPRRGVYFFFEPGEHREDGKTPRVVRVGTHAISEGSRTTLWTRLAQHRGRVGGRHPGSGNHRGSIFRLHVGTAVLNRGMGDAAAALAWGKPHRPPDDAIREAEHRVEQIVSDYIRAMSFLCLPVDDPPSKVSDRKRIETNAIALLSNFGREPIDPPSPDWLGRSATHPAIQASGLWNVKHADEEYDPSFLHLMEQYIKATPQGGGSR